jgi:hypothetical protein
MMAVGFELVTVTEPRPPDFSTGVVRQPWIRNETRIIPQRRRDAKDLMVMESIMGMMVVIGELKIKWFLIFYSLRLRFSAGKPI